MFNVVKVIELGWDNIDKLCKDLSRKVLKEIHKDLLKFIFKICKELRYRYVSLCSTDYEICLIHIYIHRDILTV